MGSLAHSIEIWTDVDESHQYRLIQSLHAKSSEEATFGDGCMIRA